MNLSTFHSRSAYPSTDGEYVTTTDLATPKALGTSSDRQFKKPSLSGADRLHKPFHYVLLVYLFLYCSRVPELVPNAHVGMVLQPILLIAAIMVGRTSAILRMPMGKILIAFTAWIAICVPFSVWKGGSFIIFVSTLQALFLVVFMAAFIRTIPDCLRVMFTVAMAMAVVGILSVVAAGSSKIADPRLAVGARGGTLADPNFLCLYILIGLPFLWMAASLRTGAKRLIMLSLMVPMLAGVARTGSRMGLLVLVVGVFYYFIFANAKQRVIVVMCGVIALMLAAFLLPQKIRERFTTYFEAHSAQSEEAAMSAQFRKQLLIRSLQLTLEHPIFGVGPGEFIDAEAQEAGEEGQRGLWHYTHNSYTELTSETGLLGGILFVMALWGSYRGLTPIRKKYPEPRVRRAALFTQMAVLMTAVGAFFLSVAYGGIIVVIVAISGTFQAAIANHDRQLRLESLEASQ